MIYPENIVSGWYYLSNLTEPNQIEAAASDLSTRVSVIPSEYQQYYQWYLDYYKSYERFPSWESFKQTAQMENEITLELSQAKKLHEKNMATWESDSLCDRMKNLPLIERRPLLDRQAKVLQSDLTESKPVMSDTDFDIQGTMVKSEDTGRSKYLFPIKRLNEVTHCREGVSVAVLAPPGMGKSQFMESFCYQNSVEGSMRGIYIYLENLPQAYMADFMSRYSFTTGNRVENSSLKDGVPEEDVAAVKVINDLKSSYNQAKQGVIYLKPFTDYPTDPLQFGTALATDINKLNLDYIVFDYIQRAKVFAPLRVDAMTYLNQLTATLTQVALGGFGANHPTLALYGVQPNREAQTKADRTHGNSLGLPSIAEVSSVERDAFLAIALYASADDKAAGQLGYKICKNRDGVVDMNMNIVPWMPQYAYIGDVVSGTDNNVFTNDAIDELFDLDL